MRGTAGLVRAGLLIAAIVLSGGSASAFGSPVDMYTRKTPAPCPQVGAEGASGMVETSKLVADVKIAAERGAKALQSSGYKADFSVASLAEVERFFVEHTGRGAPRKGGLLAEQTGPRLFMIGAYVGEVIRRAGNGIWLGSDDDPRGEINVEVHLAGTRVIWPIQRVMKRLKNGPEDNIRDYGFAVLEDLPKVPACPSGT